VKLSIVIPAFNEEHTIRDIVQAVHDVDLGNIDKEIIVVDDGSQDATADILKGLPGIEHISHSRNRGKGAALSTGFRAATGDIILIQDADLEYNPQDYRAVIAPILEQRSDVVMGSRFILEKPVFFFGKRRSPYLSHFIGNKLIVFVTNALYGQKFTDYEGCYKAFRRTVVDATPVSATGFEFDNELICKLFRKQVRVAEVPIHYTPRTYSRGKKITWRHGVKILWTIAKWRVLPL
jgi:glycosyltransferase involved in cell wall biosynthesis